MRACFWGSRYNLSEGYRFGEVIRTFNLDYQILGVVAVSSITLTLTHYQNCEKPTTRFLPSTAGMPGCWRRGPAEKLNPEPLNPIPQVLGFEAGRRESFGLKCTMVPYSNHAAKSVSAWNAFHMLTKSS